jgi:hypothetical protein
VGQSPRAATVERTDDHSPTRSGDASHLGDNPIRVGGELAERDAHGQVEGFIPERQMVPVGSNEWPTHAVGGGDEHGTVDVNAHHMGTDGLEGGREAPRPTSHLEHLAPRDRSDGVGEGVLLDVECVAAPSRFEPVVVPRGRIGGPRAYRST